MHGCWEDSWKIRLMFSNQFDCVIKTVCTAANMISLVARNDCAHSLFADTCVTDHFDAGLFRQPRTAT